ncbi:MAG: 16S rRNA processing protein RimM [Deltaproteobacteria bacterium]|nr:16S rRNA processing protein RimM [Deltaproteobacteria bacterium]
MEKNGFVPVGKIVGAHGVKGNIKIYSYTESLSVFNPGSLILLINPKGFEKSYKIKWVKPHGRLTLLSLKGVENRNTVETLIGSVFFIERASLPETEDGSYYWVDIIGSSVFTADDEYIGLVESIIPTGSNDVFVVKNPDNAHDNEILIPAIESVILEIDVERKTMRVDLPEGL